MGKSNTMNVRGIGNVVIQGTTSSNISIGNGRERETSEKILFVASNPSNTSRLRVDQEARDIEEGLRLSRNRDKFEFEIRLATRAKDLRRAILDVNPQFIHFSGHGEMNGIVLEDEQGNAKAASKEAISGLFRLFSGTLRCVFLNSCYSEIQAREIAKFIPYVIGMGSAVPDETAISFATGFYDAIGAGKDIEFAFEFGKTGISLESLPGENIPVLLKKK